MKKCHQVITTKSLIITWSFFTVRFCKLMKLSFLAYIFYTWQESTVNHKIPLNTKFQATSGVRLTKP